MLRQRGTGTGGRWVYSMSASFLGNSSDRDFCFAFGALLPEIFRFCLVAPPLDLHRHVFEAIRRFSAHE